MTDKNKDIEFKKEFGSGLSYNTKVTLGMFFVIAILGILGFSYNYSVGKQYDKKIAELTAKVDAFDNEFSELSEYELEGKDTQRIVKDMAYLETMFRDTLTFQGAEEFMACREKALETYHWNDVVVNSIFGNNENANLYDINGDYRMDINFAYVGGGSSKYYFTGTLAEGDDTYYCYTCDIVLTAGNVVSSSSYATHVVAKCVMTKNQTCSVQLRVAE